MDVAEWRRGQRSGLQARVVHHCDGYSSAASTLFPRRGGQIATTSNGCPGERKVTHIWLLWHLLVWHSYEASLLHAELLEFLPVDLVVRKLAFLHLPNLCGYSLQRFKSRRSLSLTDGIDQHRQQLTAVDLVPQLPPVDAAPALLVIYVNLRITVVTMAHLQNCQKHTKTRAFVFP